jgi:hypothetical protein
MLNFVPFLEKSSSRPPIVREDFEKENSTF